MAVVGSAEIEILPNFSKFEGQLSAGVNRATSKAGKGAGDSFGKGLDQSREPEQAAKRAGDRTASAFNQALAAIGAAVVARRVAQFFQSTVREALEFESAFAGVRKTVDATEQQFAELETGIRDMAKEIPASASAIAAVGEAAGQLGVSQENILGFSRTMIDLGETTNLSATQAAEALARFSNITGLPQASVDRLGSTIVDLGNRLAATESEILDFGLRIAGAGKIAGVADDAILGIGAAMASIGVEAEAGGTAVQKVLLRISEAVELGGEDLESFAATAGLSADEFAVAFRTNAAQAFTLFVEGLGRQGTAAIGTLRELGLEDQRLQRSFLGLAGAGDLLRRSLEISGVAFEENTALATEAEKRYQTNAAQLQVLSNRFNDVKISIGGVLAEGLIPILDTFLRLPAPIIATGVALAGIGASALGIALVAKRVKEATDALAGMGKAGRAITGVLGGVGKAAALLGPATVAIGGVLTLIESQQRPVTAALDKVAQGVATVGDVTGKNAVLMNKSLNNTSRSIEAFANSAAGLQFIGEDARATAAEFFFMASQTENTADKALLLNEASRVLHASFEEGKGAADSAALANERLGDATGDLGDTVGDAEAAYDALNKELDDFNKQIDRTLGVVLDVQGATADYEQAVDDLAASVKENGRTLDLNTEKGRENRRALIDVVEAANQLAEARVREAERTGRSLDPQQALIDAYNELRLDVVPSLRGEIDKYASALGLIPPEKSTKFTAPGLDAIKDDLAAFLRDFGKLPKNVQFAFGGGGRRGGTTEQFQHGGGWIGPRTSGETTRILEYGEYVIRKRSAAVLGKELLDTLNQVGSRAAASQLLSLAGPTPRMHVGGPVIATAPGLSMDAIVAELRALRERVDRLQPNNITVNEVAHDPEATAFAIDARLGRGANR